MEAQSLPRPGRLFLPRSPRALALFDDERLVEQVRRGNEAAFEAIYDRHHKAMLSFCRHMLSSADEAEDAVQQTFISAYRGLRENTREIKLKAWLYTIARNRCLSILRARREQPAEIDEVPTAGLSEEVQQRSDLRELLGDLRELPEDQRAALVLSELGDLSHAEIGAIVGCEALKVKSLVFQARSSLIESRNARETPCHEIREQLATATGGQLRRGPLRRHLRTCEGCSQFRDDVRRQRRALAAILPVVPTLGLKNSALAAIGLGGGGGGAAGGGLMAALGGGAATKAAALVAVAAVGLGGGLLIESKTDGPNAEAAAGQRDGRTVPVVSAAASGPGVIALNRHKSTSTIASSGPAGRRTAGKHANGNGAGKGNGNGAGKGNGHGRHHGRRHGGRAGGPGAPGAATAPGTTAPAATTPAGGKDGNHRGGNGHGHGHANGNSGPKGNNGNHRGWTIGRGHQNHPADSGGTHTPPGHAHQPAPAPAPAPADDTKHDGGKADDGTKSTSGHGHGGKKRIPALPPIS